MVDQVAFIGLGAMGFRMAKHLVPAAKEVLVWNRTESKAVEHASSYGTKAVSLEQALGAEVVFSCLPTTHEVLKLIQSNQNHLKDGLVWVDCTSGDPKHAAKLSALLAQANGHFLDAPVSGQTSGAEAATLTFMVGGEAQALSRAAPLIHHMAAKLIHVGASGSGYAVKAVNNTLLAANLIAGTEGFLLLRRLGVDLDAALQAVDASSGQSVVTSSVLPTRVLNSAYPLTFAIDLLAKDCRIATELASQCGFEPETLLKTKEVVEQASAAHPKGSQDFSTLALTLATKYNTSFK